MKKNSRPSREHHCDLAGLDIWTLIVQKPDEIRGSGGGIYNFPALNFDIPFLFSL